ncbi:MAG: hypothetical protein ACP5K9_00030 [Candidatus Micrarchaeia archaeon]
MEDSSIHLGRWAVLKTIYSSYFYWAATAIAAIAYYFFYMFVISTEHILFVQAPMLMVYLLIISSSVLLAVAIYSIRQLVHVSRSVATGGWSVFASAAGTALISCGCESPIIAPMLYLLGLNALEVSSMLSYIAAYQAYLLAALFVLNLAILYYSLGSAGGMRHPKRAKIKMTFDTGTAAEGGKAKR